MNLRSVTEEGVRHVMGLFMKDPANLHINESRDESKKVEKDNFLDQSGEIVQVVCDDAALDQSD